MIHRWWRWPWEYRNPKFLVGMILLAIGLLSAFIYFLLGAINPEWV